MITFWISAKTCDEGKTEHVLKFVEAHCFRCALDALAKEAVEKWPDRKWRYTSVTEQPGENAGVALMLDITAAHWAARAASDGKLPMADAQAEPERMVPA